MCIRDRNFDGIPGGGKNFDGIPGEDGKKAGKFHEVGESFDGIPREYSTNNEYAQQDGGRIDYFWKSANLDKELCCQQTKKLN